MENASWGAESWHYNMGYNPNMLPDLQLNDIIRLRKAHPCGGTTWKITRLGADIGLECLKCGRRVLLTRRELKNRMKQILNKDEHGTAA